MRQKREIMVSIIVAENVDHPINAEMLCKNMVADIEEQLGPDVLIGVEHIDDEWGEPV